MIEIYHKLKQILDQREQRVAVFVLFFTIVVAVIEVLGVASIMPFLAVLAKPDIVTTNSFLSYFYNLFDFHSTDDFLFFLGICVLVFLVGSTVLRAFVVWLHSYYANLRNYSISSRVISNYLQQPYEWFLMRNSSKLAAAILEEVSRVVNGTLYPVIRLISNSIIAILLLALLIVVDPTLAISIILFLTVTYGIIFKFAGKHLARKGAEVSEAQQERLKVVQEAFGGIKDVKMYGLEKFFLERYRVPTRKKALHDVSLKLWAEMPSFVMQALLFGGMMIIILYLMKTRGGIEDSIPVLAIYAFGGYKLMPALQEMYKQLAEIKYHKPALDSIYKDIDAINSLALTCSENNEGKTLSLEKTFELRGLQYSYPGSDKKSLNNITLKIEKNSTVGFVGGSGSGKTTTVDIILGLLQPNGGKVFVDDKELNKENLLSWQRSIGYVPQQIFLSDDSIAANIAFGIPAHKVDNVAVKKAALIANLHEFINELPESYNTFVGERGARLSGGQRQRIGIARALYHNPSILILDEATSALDNITEQAVMDSVNKLSHTKTIIIVAHRLSTIRSCDNIFLFENGEVVANGNYEKLIKTSSKFHDLALIKNGSGQT